MDFIHNVMTYPSRVVMGNHNGGKKPAIKKRKHFLYGECNAAEQPGRKAAYFSVIATACLRLFREKGGSTHPNDESFPVFYPTNKSHPQ